MTWNSSYEPYVILTGALFIVFLLIGIRYRLKLLGGRGSISYINKSDDQVAMSMPTGLLIGNAQTIGRRQEQDDYFSSLVTRIGTMAVIGDGISGLKHGRMASTLAVTLFGKEFLKLDDPRNITEYFHHAASMSNRGILEQLGGAHGGTTLVAAVVTANRLHYAAVGDSMILLFRDGEFMALNSRHTLETMLEAKFLSGEITREEVTNHPQRNQLINYLGYEGFKSMEIGDPITVLPDDVIILCSDGVYDALTEVDMEQILMKKLCPQETAEQMIECVERKSYKHQDNATVIIMQV
nr:protein phosphatase 2C domain-containing protein [Paenibacillus turicensis]